MTLALDLNVDRNTVHSGAIFSDDRRYRYRLWRRWDLFLPRVAVIGLNPSVADEAANDSTIRRVIGFARRDGYGGIEMLNLLGIVATDPKEIRRITDPEGPLNLTTVVETCQSVTSNGGRVVAAWGGPLIPIRYVETVRGALIDNGIELWCFGLCGKNMNKPRHPLYLPGDTKLERWMP